MRLALAGLIVALGAAMPAQAAPAGLETTLTAGKGEALVDVIVTNASDTSASYEAPSRLEGWVREGGTRHAIVLERLDEPQALNIAPGGFARLRYRSIGPLPVAQSGQQLVVEIPSLGPSAAVVESTWGGVQAADATAAPPAPHPPILSSTERADNGFSGNISAYEPIYALLGRSPNDAKMQVSLKYQLFGRRGAERTSWLDGFHLAYTQTMIWALGEPSQPFRDISFSPELMYLLPLGKPVKGRESSLQIGLRHESNGRDGWRSRSFNYLYVQPSFLFPIGSGYNLTLAPRLWVYVGPTGENPGIKGYRGWASLRADIGRADSFKLSTMVRGSPLTGRGAAQADLSYPLSALPLGANLYLHGQLFTGYGETILDYYRQTTRLRFGVSVIR